MNDDLLATVRDLQGRNGVCAYSVAVQLGDRHDVTVSDRLEALAQQGALRRSRPDRLRPARYFVEAPCPSR